MKEISQRDDAVRVQASVHERSIGVDLIAGGALSHVEDLSRARRLREGVDCTQ